MKLKHLLLSAIILAAIYSCSKDKFEEKPTLTFERVNKEYLPYSDFDFVVKLNYTIRNASDLKMADTASNNAVGVPIYYSKISSTKNCDDPARDPNVIDNSQFFQFPADLPASGNQKGEISLQFNGLSLAAHACDAADTLEEATFKFWFLDRNGNSSDTVTTPPIKIEKKY